MRVRLIKQMLGARWSYLLEHPTGRIANAFSGEVGRSQQAYQLAAQFVAEAVQTVVMLLLGLAGFLEAGPGLDRDRRWHRRGRALPGQPGEEGRPGADPADQGAGEPAHRHARQSQAAQGDGRAAGVRRVLRPPPASPAPGAASAGDQPRGACATARTRCSRCAWASAAYLAIAVLQTSLEQVIVIGVILQRTVKGFGRLQAFLQQAVIVESPFKEVETLIARARRQPGGSRRQAAAAFRARDPLRGAAVRLWQAAGAQRHQSDRARPAASPCSPGMSGAGKTTLIDLVLGLHRPADRAGS